MAKFFKIPFAATGDTLAVPDATQPDGSVSYSQGFGPDYQRKTDGTDPLAKTVPRNSTNALFNDLTGAVGEIQLNGVPVWQSVGAPYPINAIVRYNNKNWISQVTNNSATPVEGASWSEQPASSYTKAQVDTALSGKADKATTLGGYGVTDAYTKTEGDSRYLRVANNLSDLSSKVTARANLELGTSSTANVTTSSTDTTTGRVLKVSDFGVGANSLTATTPVTDWSANLPSGMYAPTGAAANPPAWGAGGVLLNMNRVGSVATSFQIGGNADSLSPRIGFRFGASTDFKEIFHTGNVSPYAQTLLDDADASAARTTLGLGTAATQTITTSSADATTGRLVKNGDKQVCTNWVNFNGQGTAAVRDSYAFSSIADLGTGNYELTFTTAKANNNYAVVANYTTNDSAIPTNNDGQASCYLYQTTGFRIIVTNGAAQAYDPLRCSAIVFGGN